MSSRTRDESIPKRGPVVSMIGRGAYPVRDVARLLSLNPQLASLVSPRSVRRWAYGYQSRGHSYGAAIGSEDFSRSTGTLSFLEVVEVMFIASSLAHGTKWSKVRQAASVAARLLANETHPFAHREWFADPGGIYLRLGKRSGEDILVEMAGDAQIAMEGPLKVYLKQIRFNKTSGIADAWYPLGADVPVLLDPNLAFGLPTVETAAVRTDLLAGHHRGGDSIPEIAYWYGVQEHEVEAAIRFEERLQSAAA